MPILLFLLVFASLFSNDDTEFSLTNLSKSPIPKVAGTVNAISGNWVDQHYHDELSGPDALPIAHSYISSSLEEGSLADGWDLFFPSDLEVYQPEGIQYKGSYSSNDATLYYREGGGATVVFKGNKYAEHMRPHLKNSGYMHINSIDKPTRRNIHRTKIHFDSDDDVWVVTLGDGTKRYYKSSDKLRRRPRPSEKTYYKRQYHIHREKLPSGNIRKYHYNSDYDITQIDTKSSDEKETLHSVYFTWHHDYVDLETSDGLTTTFYLKKLHDDKKAYIISKVTDPAQKSIHYTYTEKSNKHLRRIKEKQAANGRKVEIDFTHDEDDTFRHNRVEELRTHTYPTDKPKKAYAISYKHFSDVNSCIVREDDGHGSTFIWHKNKLPSSIYYKYKEDNLLSEKYLWDDHNLSARILRDEKKHPLLICQFHHDDHGNVIREVMRGTFTGNKHEPLTYKKEIHGGEKLTWYAKYDDRSRKTEEEDPLGNKTYFKYDRNMLAAKITCNKKRPVKREFYSYDKAAVCYEEFTDNGSSEDRCNLQDVTRRTIHRITPKRSTPFFGSPEEETWHVWTPNGGEQLLKKVRYTRDRKGRVSSKTLLGSDGRAYKTWCYTYDHYNRLTSETDPTGAQETYLYDRAGRLNKKTTPLGSVSYTYDLFDRVIEERSTFTDGSTSSQCYQYNRSGRKRRSIDDRGRVTTTYRDITGRLVKTIAPSLHTDKGNHRPKETIFHEGLKETITSPTGAKTTIKRSSAGKTLATTSPTGAKTRYFYDPNNRLIKEINPSGLVTTYEYDALSRVVKTAQDPGYTTIKKYSGFDLVEESTPFARTNYTYDSLGRLSEETVTDLVTSKTATIRTEYDALSRPFKKIYVDLDTIEETMYDLADRPVEVKTTTPDGTLLGITTTAYDLAGRVIEQGTGINNTIARTKTTYGPYGLPSAITYPDGTATHISYNPLYKGPGDLQYFRKETTDQRGVTTIELLDANDQVRDLTIKDPYGYVIAHKELSVNILGKPVEIREDAIADTKVTSTTLTRLTYDNLGQLTSATHAATTPDAATWHYSYDNLGRKIKEIKPSGTAIHSTYDARGRLATFTSSDHTINYAYTYNDQDLPTCIANGSNKTLRSYDGLGHMTSESLETNLNFSYDWTATGLLNTLIYPDNTSLSYSYEYGRLKSIHRKDYSYEVLERDLSGMITRARLPDNCGEINHTIDNMGRRTSVYHRMFSEYRTSFDPTGCCTARTIRGAHESFAYDSLSQLTDDNGRSATYDSLHRRLSYQGEQATHNSRNQLLTHGTKTFTYDADGRRTSDGYYTYTYDALDRLTSISNGSETTTYSYDPFNRRLTSTTGTEQNFFLYQGDNEIGTLDFIRILGEGLGAEIGAAIAYEDRVFTYVPIHDLSGHVRTVLYQGMLEEELDYTATGLASRHAQHLLSTPWTFASKRHDPTGLIYFGQRYYDQETSTWLTPDPVGYTAGPNLYAYVSNNPITGVDLYGLIEYTLEQERDVSADQHYEAHSSNVCSSTSEPSPSTFETSTSGNSSAAETVQSEVSEQIQPQTYGSSSPSSRSEDLKRKAKALAHGTVDFVIDLGHGVYYVCAHLASTICSHDSEEKAEYLQMIRDDLASQREAVNQHIMNDWGIDPKDSLYQSIRESTTASLEIASIALGAWSIAKGGVKTIGVLSRTSRPASRRTLTPARLRSYLKNAESVNKSQLVKDIESIGLKYKGQGKNGQFWSFMDKNGVVRAQIHPPAKNTPYHHLHIYDKTKNPLNKNLEVVNYKSPEAHIPYGEN